MTMCKNCAYMAIQNKRVYCSCKGQFKELDVKYCSWYESVKDFAKRDEVDAET